MPGPRERKGSKEAKKRRNEEIYGQTEQDQVGISVALLLSQVK